MEKKLLTQDELMVGDMVREHIDVSGDLSVYLIIELPQILGAAGKHGKWKVYDVKKGVQYDRMLFSAAYYELLHREEVSESK